MFAEDPAATRAFTGVFCNNSPVSKSIVMYDEQPLLHANTAYPRPLVFSTISALHFGHTNIQYAS